MIVICMVQLKYSYFHCFLFTAKAENVLTKVDETEQMPSLTQTANKPRPTICCLGVLPGLGAYTDSSDSENSSDSDVAENEFDLLGRRNVHHVHNVNERS